MPATEETYRKQSTLHIVFGISSLAMALVMVWMIMADHLRPWKNVQREFQKIETDKLLVSEQQKLDTQKKKFETQIAAIDSKIAEAEKRASENATKIGDLDASISKFKGRFEKLDTQTRFQKAELDSQRSFYDGMIDRNELSRARAYLVETIQPSEKRLNALTRDYEKAIRRLDRARFDKGLYSSLMVEIADPPPPGSPADAAGFQSGDTISTDDFQTMRESTEKLLAGSQPGRVEVKVRRKDNSSPTLGFEVKPRGQVSGEEEIWETWDLVGIKGAPVTKEVLAKRREDLTRDADRVRRALDQKDALYGEGSGFSGLWNKTLAFARGLPIIDLAAPPTKIQQISLPDLLINYNFKEVPRYDRCTTCHLGIDRPGYDMDAKGKKMPAPFHSHPHLTDGATAIDPKGNVVPAGLYLDSTGPHKINSFGCTICHGGQGSGTTFTFASHEPNTPHQKEEWQEKRDWYEIHHWDEPMLPKRFLESSCLKCHYAVTDVPQAEKLQAGYQRITKYGCTGCHQIGGPGVNGPDLTDNRPVGPNLRHIGSKVSKDWTLKWIRNPHAFRPDTRMPRFYDVSNNAAPGDQPKVNAEVHSITQYLYAMSTPPPSTEFVDPPATGDAARGKDLFLQKGCLACHAHKDFGPETLPTTGPLPVKDFAKANFGPNLSNMSAKFREKDGKVDSGKAGKFLTNWVKSPESYHPKSLMPNLQLSWQDSADIAQFILSVPGEWPKPVDVPSVDSDEVKQGLDELVRLYLTKSKYYKKPGQERGQTVLLSEVERFVKNLSLDDKLMYVGEKTISRLGCFGCHNIKGFDNAKPIGTALNGWGIKSPSKLDFAHISEYLDDHKTFKDDPEAAHAAPGKEAEPGKVANYDGTDPYFYEKVVEHTRPGFLYQKLHRPRSYDYKKTTEDVKSWDDRLRMPQFSWANDPVAIEEVMTFVLGLTGEKIPGKYLPRHTPAKAALAQGERLLERYNCRGCHVLEMPRYTIAKGTKVDEALPDFVTNVGTSYDSRASDYLPQFYAELTHDPKKTPDLTEDTGETEVILEGMPTATLEDEDDKGNKLTKVSIQLWRPVSIRGYTFNIGDKVVINPAKVKYKKPEGGDFPWLYATIQAEKTGNEFSTFWNRLPPPLLREGLKVQTPWLTGFFKDPYSIRPAAGLRMPRFHYGTTPEEKSEGMDALAATLRLAQAKKEVQEETRDLANYFAARDGAEFPYQEFPERELSYLTSREGVHKDYLGGGWTIITTGACVQCHSIGNFKPTGKDLGANGPDLRQVSNRFRPGYLLEWLANPSRLVPYTVMPQNVPPKPPVPVPPNVPKSFEGKQFDQVKAMRDTLLNYVNAVEQQLAVGSKAEAPAPTPPPATSKTSGGGH